MHNGISSNATGVQSLDRTYSLLSDRYRRHVVDYLADRDSEVPLDSIATAIAARESETETASLSADAIDEVATALHHVHLPKLDAADVVEYDAETKAVAPDRVESLAPLVGPDDEI